MATKQLTFHMPHEASPQVMVSILETWAMNPDQVYPSGRELLANILTTRDVPNRSEPVTFATRLGLITERSEGLTMTAIARALAFQRDAVRFDVLHYLAYTAWSDGADEELGPFWSYRSTCDELWRRAPTDIDDSHARRDLVEHVIGGSQHEFAGHPSFNGRPSYSDKSFRAILKWLDLLSPSVIEGREGMRLFRRRPACSSELLMLALGFAFQQANAEPGVEFLLSGGSREAICRLCLLDPTYLDRVLDWALARHDSFVAQADRSGSYGRFIRLRRLPTVETILTTQ